MRNSWYIPLAKHYSGNQQEEEYMGGAFNMGGEE